MNKEQMKRLHIISPLLLIVGLILMFASVSLGISLGDVWLSNQNDGIADTSEYLLVVESYRNNFVIIGSVFFSIGLIIAIIAYLSSINNENESTTISAENQE